MENSLQNLRIQKWVAGFSSVLLIIKIAAYFLTGSVAILSDALESIVNVVAGFLGLYSLYLSAKPRDADHPYGHGKVEFISAALEGSMIFIAGILIIYEAVRNLISPKPLLHIDTGIILIAITAIINFILGAWSVRIGKRNYSLALVASGKHLQSDTYSTMGVLVGLALIYFTGISWIDSAVAILFGGLLLYTGFGIIRSSLSGIMDERDVALISKMVNVLNQNRKENWIDLHNARMIKFGSVLHLDCHLTVPWYFNVREAHEEVEELAKHVRKEFGQSLELFVHEDGCQEFSCKICSKHTCSVRRFPFEKQIMWTVENIGQDRKHEITT